MLYIQQMYHTLYHIVCFCK